MTYLVNPLTRDPFPTQRATNGTLVVPGVLAQVPTLLGAAAILAPSPRAQGTVFAVEDADGVANLAPITVQGNGATIDGAPSVVLDVAGERAVFVFDGGEWRRTLLPRQVASGCAEVYRASEQPGSGGGGAAVFPFVELGAGPYPAAGLARLTRGPDGLTSRTGAGLLRRLAAVDASDRIVLGDPSLGDFLRWSSGGGLTLEARNLSDFRFGGNLEIYRSAVKRIVVTNQGLALNGGTETMNGTGVVSHGRSSSPPTANPAGGSVYFYVSPTDRPTYRQPNGQIVTVGENRTIQTLLENLLANASIPNTLVFTTAQTLDVPGCQAGDVLMIDVFAVATTVAGSTLQQRVVVNDGGIQTTGRQSIITASLSQWSTAFTHRHVVTTPGTIQVILQGAALVTGHQFLGNASPDNPRCAIRVQHLRP